jgi:hypothetical protein
VKTATYVYCLVATAARPRVPRGLKGLRHSGSVRVLALERGLWLVVSDVPLAEYGEAALKRGLSNLDWVSVAAVDHETVVEAFLTARAVLPMKLFTIFENDERAQEHIAQSRRSVSALVVRVARKDEWGIRVALSRPGPTRTGPQPTAGGRLHARSGARYLREKKAQRDDVLNRARRAHAIAADVFDTLAAHAAEARRRPATEMPAGGGSLVLDAAFLVPRSRASKLKAAAAKQARTLASQGYAISLTGPWPPYSFMQD